MITSTLHVRSVGDIDRRALPFISGTSRFFSPLHHHAHQLQLYMSLLSAIEASHNYIRHGSLTDV